MLQAGLALVRYARLAFVMSRYRQDCPLNATGLAGRDAFLRLLENALATPHVMNQPDVAEDATVVFCVTCLRRPLQLLAAMAVNCCLWWPMRKHWKLVITTFGDDADIITNLCELLDLPCRTGNVLITSGGDFGLDATRQGRALDKPSWMPNLPREALPSGREEVQLGMPLLKFWHASVAKNTSHQAAIHAFGLDVLLVNLDCDQLVPLDYLVGALIHFSRSRGIQGLCVKCGGDVEGELTGRIACRGRDWSDIKGYDEVNTPPSGGQDVDLRERLAQLAAHAGHTKKEALKTILGASVCGGALPNDFQDTAKKHDRGWAKVVHCDPEVLASYGPKSNAKAWSTMNTKGWVEVFLPRLQAKQFVRNEAIFQEKVHLGAWFVVVWQHLTEKVAQQEVPRSTVRTASQRWLDCDVDMEDADPPPHIPWPRAMPSGEAIGLDVHLVVVPGDELLHVKDTQHTRLGRYHACCDNVFHSVAASQMSFSQCLACVRVSVFSRVCTRGEGENSEPDAATTESRCRKRSSRRPSRMFGMASR